ncbi:hypothetical protein U9M48_018574, partial [Paspalum notatum var. saurae]
KTESPLRGLVRVRVAAYPNGLFNVRLVDTAVNSGLIQLYGYIAVRDERDQMLNYIFNHSRNDPVIVEQGDLIEMTGPKRGIEMTPPVLIEFDIRIKNDGGLEEDDPELIDGAVACTLRRPCKPVNYRIAGNCGTVDMTLAFVDFAVEATIEITISEVQGGLSFSLRSLLDIADDYEEIKLFQGTVDRPIRLRRFVVARAVPRILRPRYTSEPFNLLRQRVF